jgi:hypothetical protein
MKEPVTSWLQARQQEITTRSEQEKEAEKNTGDNHLMPLV